MNEFVQKGCRRDSCTWSLFDITGASTSYVLSVIINNRELEVYRSSQTGRMLSSGDWYPHSQIPMVHFKLLTFPVTSPFLVGSIFLSLPECDRADGRGRV